MAASGNTPAETLGKSRAIGEPLPGPHSPFPFGTFLEFRRDPLGFMLETAKRYGDLAQFRLGPRHAYLLNHPELVRDLLITDSTSHHRGPLLQRARMMLGEGLLTSEEPLHARQRRTIQPAFHRERIAQYAEAMLQCASRVSQTWRDGAEVDIHDEMTRLTLAIVGKSLFGEDFEADAHRITRAVTDSMAIVKFVFWPFSRVLMKLPLPSLLRYRRAQKELDRMIWGMIEQRMSGAPERSDLLSTLLEARSPEKPSKELVKQVRDECLTLVLAGHETVANALTYTFMLLARNPEAAERVRQEVAAVTGDSALRPQHFEKLVFTKAVLAESMRLYPPAWALARTASSEYSVKGHRIKKGSIVFASQYVLHRDPRYFPEPLRFSPERFLNPTHPRFSYFPFGAGPRQCIGEGFAWMEGVLVMATLLRSWHFELLFEGEPALYPAVTLRPRHPIPMKLHRIG